MRHCLLGMAVVGVIVPGLLAGCGRANDGAYDNVVLIVVDTLRADRIEAERAGVPVMPKLREYANESLYFTNATSQSSWTKPSMVSIFTSLYPEVHNVNFLVTNSNFSGPLITDVIPEHLVTLSKYLKAKGFSTAAVQSNAVMNDIHADLGFDAYHFEGYPAFRANEVTDKAIRQIRKLKGPFFSYVHYTDPHAPYDPPQQYDGLFGELPAITEADSAILNQWDGYYTDHAFNDLGLNNKRKFGNLSESARERVRTLYDGEARYIDDEVSRLVKYIESKHPNTLIIITADHGEELWERGMVGHGRSLYEEVVHVPLIVAGADISPARIDGTVETIDVFPTIAGYLGFEQEEHWQGRNLLDASEDSAADARVVFSQNRSSHESTGINQKSVRRGRYKFIRYRKKGKTIETMLFDLESDPGELTNISESHGALVAELEALLFAHLSEQKRHSLYTSEDTRREVDRTTEEAIGAIGYID